MADLLNVILQECKKTFVFLIVRTKANLFYATHSGIVDNQLSVQLAGKPANFNAFLIL